jgi:predicted O-methyltransferase YrrM
MSNISGHFIYSGAVIMQHKDVAAPFKNLFAATQPARILEIGTASGGLTMMLRDLLDEVHLPDTGIFSYDINPDYDRHQLLNRIGAGANINFQLKNLFNHAYSDLENKSNPVELIQQPGVTIVLCDGGSKKNEFRILAEYLKPGDIIMAHDYSPTLEFFEKHIHNKIWNWAEIQDSDIAESVAKYNLAPYMAEEFANVVWVSKIKQTS